MIIYGGSKETVEKQLKCNHNFEGPFIDKKFRWRTCSKCFVCDFDVRSEQDYYKTLKQNIEDEEMEESKFTNLLKLNNQPLNWYGFRKDNNLKEGETYLRKTFTMEEIKKCIEYQDSLQDKQLSKKEQEEQDEEYSGRICAEPGCYNYPMSGIIYCIRCMHGSDQKAADVVIEWKKKKERGLI